ncbi:MAG: hypothetical protein ACN4GR_16185 [Arenicellales bacterium]
MYGIQLRDINTSGQIVGWATMTNSDKHAF